jgi:hypothetical protein
MTSKVLSHCSELYQSKIMENYSLIPDYSDSVSAIQIYNTLFLLNYQVENSNICISFQNKAVENKMAKI